MHPSQVPDNWAWRDGSVDGGPAVVFDMDGVLSDAAGRQHYLDRPYRDWEAFFHACGEDPLIEEVARLLDVIGDDHRVVLLTARPIRVQRQTLGWLDRFDLRWDLLIMRDFGDYGASREFKRRSVAELRGYGFDLRLAFEDDRRNVHMFHSEGVPCIYIHSGYYDWAGSSSPLRCDAAARRNVVDDPYQVLGLAPGASLEEAEAAFRARLHEVHPDRHPDAEGTEASAHAAETARITEAIRELRYRLREVREVHRCRACGAPVDAAVSRCPVCGDDPSSAPWWHGPPPGEVPAAAELGGGRARTNRDWSPQPHSGGIGVIVVTLLALLLFAAIYWGMTQVVGGR